MRTGKLILGIILLAWTSFAEARFDAGLAVAGFTYKEEYDHVKGQQVNLQADIFHRQALKWENWAARTTASITLLPLSSSYSSQDPLGEQASRIYSLESCITYDIPADTFGAESLSFKVGLGFQGWGMLVPGNNYGVRIVFGPQWTLIMGGKTARKLPWESYISVAPLSDHRISFELSSYRAELGAFYPLMVINKRHLLSTYGVAEWTSMNFSYTTNSVDTFTPKIGLRYSF